MSASGGNNETIGWDVEHLVTFEEIWNDDTYEETGLPREVPMLAAVSVGVYRQACLGIPLAVRFVGRDRLLWNSMVQGTQRFRQVQAASLRNTLCLV